MSIKNYLDICSTYLAFARFFHPISIIPHTLIWVASDIWSMTVIARAKSEGQVQQVTEWYILTRVARVKMYFKKDHWQLLKGQAQRGLRSPVMLYWGILLHLYLSSKYYLQNCILYGCIILVTFLWSEWLWFISSASVRHTPRSQVIKQKLAI